MRAIDTTMFVFYAIVLFSIALWLACRIVKISGQPCEDAAFLKDRRMTLALRLVIMILCVVFATGALVELVPDRRHIFVLITS